MALGAAILVAPVLAACGSDGDGRTIVNLYYAPEDKLEDVVANCNEAAGGRYEIVYTKLPREADGQREQMVRRLAAGDADMDVMSLDVTWTAEFAEAGWIQEWTGDAKDEAENGTLQGPLDSASWEGKLFAAPKNTNVQLLWYRSDLVDEAPETFDDLIAAARQLKDAGDPYVVGMTGAQYEGLVVQYNTLTASAGGRLVSEDGKQAVVDEGAVKALETLKNFATSGVASTSLSNAKEDDVRLAFQNEQMAFQLNWPYVYAAMQTGNPDLQFEWARYPGIDGPAKVTIGGFNLAVSKYSEHPEEAFEAALCLRNEENQKYSAINSGVPPTIEAVYDDPEMDEAYPMKETILEELKDAAVRPVTPAYQNASTIISTVLSPPQDIDPQRTAERLREELQDALDSKGVLP
ncbi:MAG TPA: ABC transporter substrate-binding protein [Pseudonocardiaceae bacterium]